MSNPMSNQRLTGGTVLGQPTPPERIPDAQNVLQQMDSNVIMTTNLVSRLENLRARLYGEHPAKEQSKDPQPLFQSGVAGELQRLGHTQSQGLRVIEELLTQIERFA